MSTVTNSNNTVLAIAISQAKTKKKGGRKKQNCYFLGSIISM